MDLHHGEGKSLPTSRFPLTVPDLYVSSIFACLFIKFKKIFTSQSYQFKGDSINKNSLLDRHPKIDKASSYFNNNGEKIDIKMESMKGLFDGNKTLYVHADYYTEIIDAIDLLKKKKIKKIVLVGGEEALIAKNIIKNNNINVILNRVHRLPSKVGSSIYEPYTQAKLLHENEILFCFSYEGDMEVMGSRNLPFTAGTSVAYGLDYNIAIKSLTLNAAKILGVDNKLGSLEAGKEATFFISDGDALDIMSNNLFLAFIKGETIKLTNHQTELYEKFK